MNPKEYRVFTDWLVADYGALIGEGGFVADKLIRANWNIEMAVWSISQEQLIIFCGILTLVLISSIVRMRLIGDHTRQIATDLDTEAG